MKSIKKSMLVFGMALACLASNNADASIELVTPNSALSGLTGPFGTVEVSNFDYDEQTATITATSNFGLGYLFGNGGSLSLNVNGAYSNTIATTDFVTTQPTLINGSTPNTPYFTTLDSGNVSDFGFFNFHLKAFDGATHAFKTLTFELVGDDTSWTDASDVLVANEGGSMVSAHIFTYSILAGDNFVDNNLTGFVGDGDLISDDPLVPEPTAAIIWSMLALGGFVGYRRRSA